ncbi:ferric iron reductase [Rhizobium rhizogenes]|uniref:Ferric iron reductase n=2 Tax=Rhizobiaceae TaxID=82115 RepID=A0A546X9C6_RHIRH|nr:ferric iron reductase [Rhizobium rhizogenes]
MRRTMRHHETAGVPEASDILTEATVLQQSMWPEVPCSTGAMLPGWTTAAELFSSPSALQEFLDYEGSFDPGVDLKSRAAFLMSDYCYIFFMATVPLLVGRGIVPDMSPDAFSLQFYTHHGEHDGEPMTVRRARVRLLSPQIFADRDDGPHSTVTDHAGLCEHFRMGVEQHFHPLVEALAKRTGFSKNAQWRLVGDAIAGRFLDVGRRFGCLADALSTAMAIVKVQGSPLNNRQLGYFDLTLHDSALKEPFTYTFRARGGCCRYYTVVGAEKCPTCVLKSSDERDACLLQEMRAHFCLK